MAISFFVNFYKGSLEVKNLHQTKKVQDKMTIQALVKKVSFQAEVIINDFSLKTESSHSLSLYLLRQDQFSEYEQVKRSLESIVPLNNQVFLHGKIKITEGSQLGDKCFLIGTSKVSRPVKWPALTFISNSQLGDNIVTLNALLRDSEISSYPGYPILIHTCDIADSFIHGPAHIQSTIMENTHIERGFGDAPLFNCRFKDTIIPAKRNIEQFRVSEEDSLEVEGIMLPEKNLFENYCIASTPDFLIKQIKADSQTYGLTSASTALAILAHNNKKKNLFEQTVMRLREDHEFITKLNQVAKVISQPALDFLRTLDS